MVVDCQLAGISGDMTIGALLDLGVDEVKIVEAMESVKDHLKGCSRFKVNVTPVYRRGFRAKRVNVEAEETFKDRKASALKEALVNSIEHVDVSKGAQTFALDCIDTLIEAETRVHGREVEEIHLHEIGSADTLADILGVTVALEELGFFKDLKCYSTPVAVGGGLFKFSHGITQSPAPITAEILRMKAFPMVGGPVKAELATPTGVALLVNMVRQVVEFYPAMKPQIIGYGAGAKDFEESPNVLRITLGTLLTPLPSDEVYVLETNLDDITGEVIGYTLEKMLSEGAKDVSIIPIIAKKNRPGHIVKAIVDYGDVDRLTRVLIEETGTLGVRVYPCKRHILTRRNVQVEVQVEGLTENVDVKVATDPDGNILQVKPEYDDVKRLAEKTGRPLKALIDQIVEKARKISFDELSKN